VVTTRRAGARAYRSPQRAAQTHRTRERILDAAVTEFLSRGYALTTVRAVASSAEVSVPTVERLFGTKARLLKAAIDIAIAGDHAPVPVLERGWTVEATAPASVEAFLAVAVDVIAVAQARSAGLVLAAFEAGPSDADLHDVATQLVEQRVVTAGWLVDRLAEIAPLRRERDDAVDTLWLLMDPAVYDRLTRQRNWSAERYRRWLIDSVTRLLLVDRGKAVPP
jgi:AcrR family transcriptional regulator